MNAIAAATERARRGETDTARAELVELWTELGPHGDPLHRCTLAHYLADMYTDPARALAWDIRALDAADALTDARVQRHHDSLHIAGFYPSLHLNLADNYRLLGSFDAATEHLVAAGRFTEALPDDAYGRMIRRALDETRDMIAAGSRERRPSAPGSTGS